MNEYAPHQAISAVFHAISIANLHVQDLEPWKKDATCLEIHRALFYAREALRISAVLLQCFMPEKMCLLMDRLGVPTEERGLAHLQVGQGRIVKIPAEQAALFPSIHVPAQVEALSK